MGVFKTIKFRIRRRERSLFLLSFILTILVSLLALFFLRIYTQQPTVKTFDFKAVVDDCAKSNVSAPQCWSDKIDNITETGSVDQALDFLAYLYGTQPNFGQTCHSLAHEIGFKAADLFVNHQDFKVTSKASFCGYGFYHGFMEKLLAQTNNFEQARNFCDYVDKQLSNESSDAKLQCFHGIGHGTAYIHDPRIAGDEELILKPALQTCQRVSRNKEELYRCSSGAFNALALDYMSGEYNLPLDKNDPLKICRQQEDQFQEPCYGNMNTLLAWLADGDNMKAQHFIEGISDDKLAASTEIYYGALVSINYVQDLAPQVDICHNLQLRLQIPCVVGIVHGLMEHGKPGQEYLAAFDFCNASYLNKAEKDSCYKEAVPYMSSIYPPDKASQICQSLDPNYLSLCRKV